MVLFELNPRQLKVLTRLFHNPITSEIFTKSSGNQPAFKIYALMGANGSGKTTLFNLINGFHKPHSGNIVFKQQNIADTVPYKINRIGIGRTFQDLRLVSKLTVKENVLLAMQGNPTDHWIKALLPSSVFKKDLRQLESKAEEILGDYFLQNVQNYCYWTNP